MRPILRGAPPLALAILLALPAAGGAVPRYALRVGQSCVLCHQNPSGAGQRSAYATEYLVPTRIARPQADDAPRPHPQISDDLLLGADLRTFWMHRDDRDERNNFVQMAGSVYASIQLDPRALAYIHTELGQGEARAHELFGLAWLAPGQAWVKVGRFVPAYGWRPPDHRTFTRRSFVFLPENPPQSDTGIELGARRGPVELQVALTNGEFASAFELNDELAFVARGSAMRRVGPGNVAIGGSYAQHRGLDAHRWAGGPFAGAAFGRLAWWGEFDWVHLERPSPPPGVPGARTSFTTSQELSVALVQGLDLVATYDFHDPNTDLESGAGNRAGVGVEALPYPFLQLRAKLNRFERDGGAEAPPVPDGVTAVELEVHFLY